MRVRELGNVLCLKSFTEVRLDEAVGRDVISKK